MPYVFLVAAAARVRERRVPARRSIAPCSMQHALLYCRHCIQPLPSAEAGADEKKTEAAGADEKKTEAGADEKKLDAAEADEKKLAVEVDEKKLDVEADEKKLDAAEADSR